MKKRDPVVIVVVAVVIALMLFFGIRKAHRAPVAELGPATSGSPAKSRPAPDFSLQSLDGKTLRLSDFKGKAVLLNFWATWCEPCKIEMPWFVDLQNKYGAQGLQVLGVAMDDSDKKDIAKFVKDMGVNYPVAIGKEAVGNDYGGVQFLPETFFIDRAGRVQDKVFGLKGKGEIEDSIKKILASQGEAAQAAK